MAAVAPDVETALRKVKIACERSKHQQELKDAKGASNHQHAHQVLNLGRTNFRPHFCDALTLSLLNRPKPANQKHAAIPEPAKTGR